jgi:hypothetical protein
MVLRPRKQVEIRRFGTDEITPETPDAFDDVG